MTYLIRYSIGICIAFGTLVLGSVALGADDADEGTIIRIGPDRGAQQQANPRAGQQGRWGRRVPNRGDAPVVVSRYWIGIEGAAPSAALRSQLRLEPEEGILINRVMPNSPAEEGELEQFDVITRVNGKQVASVPELSEHVGEQGENKGRLAIEIIRQGKPRTVWVAPVERPIEQFQRPQPRRPFGIDQPLGQFPFGQEFFKGGPFGEGGIENFNQQIMVNGVSIKVSQENGGTKTIVVQRDGETWEVNEQDPESLEALPDDLRPMVERMLKRPAAMEGGGFGQGFGRNPLFEQEIFQEKLEEMQQQMQALQQQIGVEQDLTNHELEEKQEEQAEQDDPTEIELPPEQPNRRF